MIKVRKKPGLVMAFRLGGENPLEAYFIKLDKIRKSGDCYEVFSKETMDNRGQKAKIDDYIKIDREGEIYPVSVWDFEKNQKFLSANIYLEADKVRKAFRADDLDGEIISYLMDKEFLKLSENPDKYFVGQVRSGQVYGKKDSYLLIYSEDMDGPCKYDFNFVDKDIFEKTYEIL